MRAGFKFAALPCPLQSASLARLTGQAAIAWLDIIHTQSGDDMHLR